MASSSAISSRNCEATYVYFTCLRLNPEAAKEHGRTDGRT